jgi:hypothetical protein
MLCSTEIFISNALKLCQRLGARNGAQGSRFARIIIIRKRWKRKSKSKINAKVKKIINDEDYVL